MKRIYMKESVGFLSFVKELWLLWKERQLTRRALRILNEQEWSVEFLTSLLVRAAAIRKQPLEMTIMGPRGTAIKVNTLDDTGQAIADDDIFNHLDDELKIKQYMDQLTGQE
jgi:hypothetical protein